ncbi:MAG: transketolase family protein [Candidatus Methylomirabilia bacterium]
MRRAFVRALEVLADRDPRVVLLTGDLGFEMFDNFIAKHGPRYVNVGVAEAQLVTAAAGLALEGFRPFVYSIASFMTGRPYEQIRVSLAYHHLPVVIVGAGGGYCYSSSGVTHHASDDLALMSLLPGMTVVAPGDPNEVEALLPQLLALAGPSYLRIGKSGEPGYEAASPVVLGKARLLREGRQVAILSSGEMAPTVLAARDALAAESVEPEVWQFHTVKPLDTATLDRLVGRFPALLVVEESSPLGGLGSVVAAWHSGLAGDRPQLVRLGPKDALALGSLRRETLMNRWGYGRPAVVDACRELWRA